MPTIRHLERQRDELQRQYDLLSTLIQGLGERLVLETNPAEELKLMMQKEHSDDKRRKIDEQIQVLDEQIETLDIASKLHKALLKLDFHRQEILFRQLIGRSQVGAFLISGEPGFGQSWLLNRLISQVPYVTVGNVIPINLQFRGRRWDFDAMQREIKRRVGLTNTHSLQDVIEQIHGWWQTQTVVLVFHNLDTIDAKYMQEFIHGFWLPLVDKAINVPCQSPYYKLLMFLVDNNGCVDTWSFDCVEQLDASWKPHILIKPPRLSPIQSDDLLSWVRHEYAVLPSGILNIQIEEILRNSSDGFPQAVLEYICELCGCDWYEKEHIWIKY